MLSPIDFVLYDSTSCSMPPPKPEEARGLEYSQIEKHEQAETEQVCHGVAEEIPAQASGPPRDKSQIPPVRQAPFMSGTC